MEFSCPVCGSAQCKFQVTTSNKIAVSSWYKCNSCNSESIAPLPSKEKLYEYYNQSYENIDVGREFADHSFRFTDNADANLVIFDEYRMSLLDIGFNVQHDFKKKKILDYGCANGVFLEWLREEALCNLDDIYGFDLSERFVRKIIEKGFKPFRPHQDVNLTFDLVFLWDVIEHCLNPACLIANLYSLLAKGGQLIIQTPQIGFLSDKLQSKFSHYIPLEHVILFSREGLIKLLNDNGFRILKAGSFGANAPIELISNPYKGAYDAIAKMADAGATQVIRAVKH